MTNDAAQLVAATRCRELPATARPLRWHGNTGTGDPYLTCPVPGWGGQIREARGQELSGASEAGAG